MFWLFPLYLVSAQTCPQIQCGGLAYPQCFTSNTMSESVSQCPPSTFCNISSLQPGNSAVCEPTNLNGTRYPGDYCSLNVQCESGLCENNLCTGPSYMESCTTTQGCLPGFYCNGTNCLNQIKPGGTCSSDYNCVNYAFCNLGICTEYWSLVAGEAVSQPIMGGLSLGCKSGAAYDNGKSFVCTNADASAQLPTTCSAQKNCTSPNQVFTSECTCGYNPTGTYYCPLFPGDPQVQAAIAASGPVLGNNSVCNSFSRFSINCFVSNQSVLPQFLEFAVNYWLSFEGYYPKTVNSTACINANLNSDYYELLYGYENLNTPQCPSFYCLQESAYGSSDQCVLSVNDVFNGNISSIQFAASCSSGYYCNSTSPLQNSTCVQMNSLNRPGYPGDFCNSTYPCESGRCQDNICLGIREGEVCINPHDCQPGFFCNQTTFVCQVLKKKFQTCKYWYECSNNLVCNLGTCINYFSLQNQERTDLITGNVAQACISGFAVLSGNDSICMPAPLTGINTTCRYPGDTCYDSSGKYNKTCACIMSNYSNGNTPGVVCPPFEGDQPLHNAIMNLISLLSWNQVCNTYSRLHELCFLRNFDYLGPFYYFITNLTLFTNYSAVYDVQDCVKKTFMFQEYLYERRLNQWEYENGKNNPGDNDDSFAAYFVVTGIILNLF